MCTFLNHYNSTYVFLYRVSVTLDISTTEHHSGTFISPYFTNVESFTWSVAQTTSQVDTTCGQKEKATPFIFQEQFTGNPQSSTLGTLIVTLRKLNPAYHQPICQWVTCMSRVN